MLTENQRIARKQGLGGSDIAAICGMNPYKTALDVWVDKTSDITVDDIDNLNMSVGNALESLVADTYLRHRNEGRIEFAEPGITISEIETVVNTEYSYLRANIDRLINDGGVLEIKTALSYGSQKQWREGIPEYHRFQIAYYAYLLNAPYADVAVLCVGEKTPRYYRYERDTEFENYIIDTAHAFWNNFVLTRTMPTEYSAGTYVAHESSTSTCESDESIKTLVDELAKIKAYKDDIAVQEEHIRGLITAYMGKNTTLTYNGRTLATFKPQSRATFDSTRFKKDQPEIYKTYTKTSETRVLRLSTEKKEEI
jgi:putative phage-type endonuclease